MIVVTYRLFDLNIDIGKILGDVGGLLFSSRKDGNDTNTNEETAEGELGNILVYLQLISIRNLICRKNVYLLRIKYCQCYFYKNLQNTSERCITIMNGFIVFVAI